VSSCVLLVVLWSFGAGSCHRCACVTARRRGGGGQDGRVSFEEFERVVRLREAEDATLRAMFRSLDASGTGVLSAADLLSFLRATGDAPELVAPMLAMADVTGDGQARQPWAVAHPPARPASPPPRWALVGHPPIRVRGEIMGLIIQRTD
jgi:hypothetical protein